jgi:hypothetical protein
VMPISDVQTWREGPYTVRQQPRNDNPYWPCYLVFLDDVLMGKSFSRPDLGCCDWIRRQYEEGRTVYADSSAPLYQESIYRRGKSGKHGTFSIKRRGRPTNAERARREAMLLSSMTEEEPA